ncbi:hypothetical protein COCOBI_pt-1360 (chloroplast) [Coccomyxa sp. Obi]|nr:hypothetical protein COCOBI_pt-1360 [Coccomyxa sp. Obi]
MGAGALMQSNCPVPPFGRQGLWCKVGSLPYPSSSTLALHPMHPFRGAWDARAANEPHHNESQGSYG